MPFSTNPYNVFPADQLYKGQIAESPTILDSFDTTISLAIGMEVGGSEKPQSGLVFNV